MEINAQKKFFSERDALILLMEETSKAIDQMDMTLIKECLYFLYPENEEEDRAYIERTLPILHEKLGFNRPAKAVRRSRPRMALVAVLIVLGVLMLASVVAYAFGINVFNFFVEGTKEYWMIHMKTENEVVDTIAYHAPIELYEVWGDAVTDRLKEMDTIPPLPTSILEGYEFVSHAVEEVGDFFLVNTFEYKSTDKGDYIRLSIREHYVRESEYIEYFQKDNTTKTGEIINGIEYFFSQNYDVVNATWMIGRFQVTLSGTCSMEDLRRMIDTVL